MVYNRDKLWCSLCGSLCRCLGRVDVTIVDAGTSSFGYVFFIQYPQSSGSYYEKSCWTNSPLWFGDIDNGQTRHVMLPINFPIFYYLFNQQDALFLRSLIKCESKVVSDVSDVFLDILKLARILHHDWSRAVEGGTLFVSDLGS